MIAQIANPTQLVQIKKLIANNQIEKAINHTFDFIQSQIDKKILLNELIILSAAYLSLQDAYERDLIPFEESERMKKKLLIYFLKFLDELFNT